MVNDVWIPPTREPGVTEETAAQDINRWRKSSEMVNTKNKVLRQAIGSCENGG